MPFLSKSLVPGDDGAWQNGMGMVDQAGGHRVTHRQPLRRPRGLVPTTVRHSAHVERQFSRESLPRADRARPRSGARCTGPSQSGACPLPLFPCPYRTTTSFLWEIWSFHLGRASRHSAHVVRAVSRWSGVPKGLTGRGPGLCPVHRAQPEFAPGPPAPGHPHTGHRQFFHGTAAATSMPF